MKDSDLVGLPGEMKCLTGLRRTAFSELLAELHHRRISGHCISISLAVALLTDAGNAIEPFAFAGPVAKLGDSMCCHRWDRHEGVGTLGGATDAVASLSGDCLGGWYVLLI